MEAVLARIKEIEDAGNAPATPDRPFEHKYAARDELGALMENLPKLGMVTDERILPIAQALAMSRIGVNMVDCEETGAGEQVLTQSLEVMEPHVNDSSLSSMIPYVVDAYNSLGILWTQRSEMDKAEQFLKKAEALSDDVQTLYYLAQVYVQAGRRAEGAHYVRLTMKKQLGMSDFNRNEWADHAIYLSGYYLSANRFGECEHCLAAAQLMIDRMQAAYVEQKKEQPQQDAQAQEEDGQEEEFVKGVKKTTVGNMGLGWGKYYLFRMKHSRDREPFPASEEHVVLDDFSEELGIPKPRVISTYVDTFEEARELFKKALQGFSRAMDIYVLDGYVSDHVAIAQDISLLYKVLASFEKESETDRIAAMHRRRAAQLEPIVNALSLQHYLGTVRQLCFELGSIWADVLDVSLGQAKKAHEALTKALAYYERFVRSYDEARQKSGGRFPEDSEEAAVLALFHIARLNAKVAAVPSLVKALTGFEEVVNYAAKWNPELLPDEVEIARQMKDLLPVKISTMRP